MAKNSKGGAGVNNQTARRSEGMSKGRSEVGSEMNDAKEKSLPFPESWTVKQGSMNGDMPMEPPEYEKERDFATEEFTTENRNPNNESYAKSKQPKGTSNLGLGEIGRLANNDKWGNTGKS